MTRRTSIAATIIVLVGALVALAVPAAAQPRRVDSGARQILDYRLTPDHVRRFDDVMRAMDRAPDRGTQGSRADLAVFSALAGAADAWRDSMVDDMVRAIDPGQPDLVSAIRSAGMTTREYVLTTMNLILAYSAASSRRQGRASTVGDVADANVDMVQANWSDVDRTMRDLQHRMDAARRR